jgi:hypothetical protein
MFGYNFSNSKDHFPSVDPKSLGEALSDLRKTIRSLGNDWSTEPIIRFTFDTVMDTLLAWCAHVDVHQRYEAGHFGPQYIRGRVDVTAKEIEILGIDFRDVGEILKDFAKLKSFATGLKIVPKLTRYL